MLTLWLIIGANSETEFTEGLQYAIAAPNRRKFVTKQYAVVAIGKTSKPFPFVMFSDSDITMVSEPRGTSSARVVHP